MARADGGIELRGRVVDARTGEGVPDARVRVSDGRRETTVDAEGRFAFVGLERRSLTLRVSAPGYRPFTVRLALGTASAEFAVPLEREPPRLAESVTVTADGSSPAAEAPPPLARGYDGEELMAFSSVAASDPLRAVQALPGLAANDEFNAGFAARGSGFASAGLSIDGVRLSAPFHTIRDINDGYTLTIFNGDVVDSVSLMPGAAPARYGDRVGAMLAVRTREGRADGFHGKASLGAAGVFATLEGPVGKKASWLASARQSYLDYILERVDDDPRLALGYRDLTARLVARPRPSQTISLLALFGRAAYENTERDPLRPHHGERRRRDGPPPALVATRLGRAGPRGDGVPPPRDRRQPRHGRLRALLLRVAAGRLPGRRRVAPGRAPPRGRPRGAADPRGRAVAPLRPAAGGPAGPGGLSPATAGSRPRSSRTRGRRRGAA